MKGGEPAKGKAVIPDGPILAMSEIKITVLRKTCSFIQKNLDILRGLLKVIGNTLMLPSPSLPVIFHAQAYSGRHIAR